jgi:serine/threonine kinase 32
MSLVATQKSAKSTVFVGSPVTGGGSPPLYTSDDMNALAQVDTQESMFEPGRPRTTTKGKNPGMRNESPAGGVQMVLDEAGSWTTLADKSATVPPPKQKPSGMLGFLSKRKGRASSPKPQERGVLGREGARVIIA